jgi:hypothetical protein
MAEDNGEHGGIDRDPRGEDRNGHEGNGRAFGETARSRDYVAGDVSSH